MLGAGKEEESWKEQQGERKHAYPNLVAGPV